VARENKGTVPPLVDGHEIGPIQRGGILGWKFAALADAKARIAESLVKRGEITKAVEAAELAARAGALAVNLIYFTDCLITGDTTLPPLDEYFI